MAFASCCCWSDDDSPSSYVEDAEDRDALALRLRSSNSGIATSVDPAATDREAEEVAANPPPQRLFTGELTSKDRGKLLRNYTPETILGLLRIITRLQEKRDPDHLYRYPLGEDPTRISGFFLCRYEKALKALNTICDQLDRWLAYYRLHDDALALLKIQEGFFSGCYELATPLSIAVTQVKPFIFMVVKRYRPKQGVAVNALMTATVACLQLLCTDMRSLDALFQTERSWIVPRRKH
jgi:hypothetical protein